MSSPRTGVRSKLTCDRILFSGVATTKLPELDCVTTAAGVTRCRSKDGLGWTAEVNDVVWRTEHKPVS